MGRHLRGLKVPEGNGIKDRGIVKRTGVLYIRIYIRALKRAMRNVRVGNGRGIKVEIGDSAFWIDIYEFIMNICVPS